MMKAVQAGVVLALLGAGSAGAETIRHANAAVLFGSGGSITEVAQAGLDVSVTGGYDEPPNQFVGSAWGAAQFGRLVAGAQGSVTGAMFETQTAHGEAGFGDVLTIHGPGSGAAFVRYHYLLTGGAEGNDHDLEAHAHAHLFVRHGLDADEELGEDIEEGGELISADHAITLGQPFAMGLAMLASVQLAAGTTHAGESVFEARLLYIEVFDESGLTIDGLSAESESGTVYAVPGAGGAGLLGLTVVLAARRRLR